MNNNINELDENNNSITYDKDWQSVSRPEYPKTTDYEEILEDNSQEENSSAPRRKKDSPRQLLITIQLIVCIIIALAAFVLKNIGGEVYETARDWYYSNLNSSVIFDTNSDLSLEKLFGRATSDEA